MVAHGTSFLDAPSATVGYIRIEDEIIRYTGTTVTTFTGCTRGALNSKAVEHIIDASASTDRLTEVREFIYLEMPAVKLAYALYTGTLYGQGASLPSHWSLNIDTDYIATSFFTGIGVDLWDPSNDVAGFTLRFAGLEKRDAKKFIQEQVYMPRGLFPIVLADGQLAVKRMTSVVSGSSPVAVLDSSNVIKYSKLDHDQDALSNNYTINWNWNESKDDWKGAATRRNIFVDENSIAIHQSAEPFERTFEGLHGSRHTDSVIHGAFDALRDRYSGPPIRLNVLNL